jgi:hypothetical protein
LTENLTDPATAASTDPLSVPFQRAFKTDKVFFDWLSTPENSVSGVKFNIAMGARIEVPKAIVDGDYF